MEQLKPPTVSKSLPAEIMAKTNKWQSRRELTPLQTSQADRLNHRPQSLITRHRPMLRISITQMEEDVVGETLLVRRKENAMVTLALSRSCGNFSAAPKAAAKAPVPKSLAASKKLQSPAWRVEDNIARHNQLGIAWPMSIHELEWANQPCHLIPKLSNQSPQMLTRYENFRANESTTLTAWPQGYRL